MAACFAVPACSFTWIPHPRPYLGFDIIYTQAHTHTSAGNIRVRPRPFRLPRNAEFDAGLRRGAQEESRHAAAAAAAVWLGACLRRRSVGYVCQSMFLFSFVFCHRTHHQSPPCAQPPLPLHSNHACSELCQFTLIPTPFLLHLPLHFFHFQHPLPPQRLSFYQASSSKCNAIAASCRSSIRVRLISQTRELGVSFRRLRLSDC